MQSPSSPSSDPKSSRSQHSSPQRTSSSSPPSNMHTPDQYDALLQNIPSVSRDTTPVASSKPSTPPSNARSQPLTPPDSATRSSAASVAPAPPAVTTTGSTLSATAPQFRTRLIDAPIDLPGFVQPPTDGSAPLLQKPTMLPGGRGDLHDFSSNLASFDDGRSKSIEPAMLADMLTPQ